MNTIDAIYVGGKFQPLGDVSLVENQRVRLTINLSPTPITPSEDEILRRIEAAKSLAELFEARKGLPEDDGDYDFETWIQESRKLAGETPYLDRLP